MISNMFSPSAAVGRLPRQHLHWLWLAVPTTLSVLTQRLDKIIGYKDLPDNMVFPTDDDEPEVRVLTRDDFAMSFAYMDPFSWADARSGIDDEKDVADVADMY